MIRVLVNGALGRMGSEVCKKVYSEADLELVGAVDIKEGTVQLGDGVKVTTDLVAAIEAAKPDVVVDLPVLMLLWAICAKCCRWACMQ